ncbi:MAG: Uma2 family endonuclease [Planctomycetes bacterium]|nr:Uma2 family endonuclease [Planctomycetota bacterium]
MRWTAEQFNQMGDMGWFEGRRAFLLDGVIWEQGPMNPPHATALELLDIALRAAFGVGWRFRNQTPLTVDEYNDPFPDYAVVRGTPRDSNATHPATASLIVEVSDTTLQTDLTVKAERYATAGVTDYWVLDIVNRQLIVLRDPAPLPEGLGATAYRDQKTYAPTERISPLAAPQASILISDLLP